MHFYKESFFGWGYQKCKSILIQTKFSILRFKTSIQRFISSGTFQIQNEVFSLKFIGDSDVDDIVM